mmetsp:Transcript_35756/g.84762  ORF Transcript_35756/g.84762 Transcript_35756/m.84762 type:complete len:308 (+) Transcript_35756:377-1300(+)
MSCRVAWAVPAGEGGSCSGSPRGSQSDGTRLFRRWSTRRHMPRARSWSASERCPPNRQTLNTGASFCRMDSPGLSGFAPPCGSSPSPPLAAGASCGEVADGSLPPCLAPETPVSSPDPLLPAGFAWLWAIASRVRRRASTHFGGQILRSDTGDAENSDSQLSKVPSASGTKPWPTITVRNSASSVARRARRWEAARALRSMSSRMRLPPSHEDLKIPSRFSATGPLPLPASRWQRVLTRSPRAKEIFGLDATSLTAFCTSSCMLIGSFSELPPSSGCSPAAPAAFEPTSSSRGGSCMSSFPNVLDSS